MPTKRGDAIQPRLNPWRFLATDLAAGKGWDELLRQFPEAATRAWVAITSDPRHHDDRQHQLRGSLGTTYVGGRELQQWQYEATGAARVRYAIDDEPRTLWLTDAGTGHPKDSDTRRRRKR